MGQQAGEALAEEERIIQITWKTGFAIKPKQRQRTCTRDAVLGTKTASCHTPGAAINKIITVSPPANKKKTHPCLVIVGYWRMHARLQSAYEPSPLSDPKEKLF